MSPHIVTPRDPAGAGVCVNDALEVHVVLFLDVSGIQRGTEPSRRLRQVCGTQKTSGFFKYKFNFNRECRFSFRAWQVKLWYKSYIGYVACTSIWTIVCFLYMDMLLTYAIKTFFYSNPDATWPTRHREHDSLMHILGQHTSHCLTIQHPST